MWIQRLPRSCQTGSDILDLSWGKSCGDPIQQVSEYLKKWAVISNQKHCSTCHNYCWLGAWGPLNREEGEMNKNKSIGQALENHRLSSGGTLDSWLSGWCSRGEFIWRTGDWCGAPPMRLLNYRNTPHPSTGWESRSFRPGIRFSSSSRRQLYFYVFIK